MSQIKSIHLAFKPIYKIVFMSIFINNIKKKPNWAPQHHMLSFLWKYSLLITSYVLLTNEQSFDQYKRNMEQIVIEIASRMQQYYSNWCTEGIATCEALTYNGCLGVRSKYCDEQFVKPSCCFYPGAYKSSASSINFPPGINYNNLSQQDIHFVCSSARLQQTFQNISKNRNGKFSSMYFASYRGLFRQYPGQYRGDDSAQCDDFDPRHRPWYTSASSGAKNIIILLDISSSMMNKSQDAITIANSVISSLGISDNIGIIAFQSDTTVIGDQQQILIKATSQNKQKLLKALNNIQFKFHKQTSFAAAFIKGLDVVNNTIAKGYSGCSAAQNIFLLITDGNPTIDNKTSADQLISYIDNYTKSKGSSLKRLIVFIFALGNVNVQYLRNLSCYFNGIVITPSATTQQIQSTSEAATQLIQFYKYLSVGVKFTQPIWTEPYLDYYTNLKMITISMPAYHTDWKTNLTTMFGVAGLDISMKYFDNFGYTFDEIILKLTGESACQKSILDNCKLQGFRSTIFRCNQPNCTINLDNSSICLNVPPTSQIYINIDITTDRSFCCGITTQQFIIIICICSSITIIIIILIWKRKIIWKKFCSRKYRKINKQDRNQRNSNKLSNKTKNKKKKSKNCQDGGKNQYNTQKNLGNLDQEHGQPGNMVVVEPVM